MTAPADEPTTTTAEQDSDLINVEGLIKHFPIRAGLLRRQVGAVQAVDGIDFGVKRRETFSIVGESGCGKSTTARLLTRLLEPTSGKITFEGRDISHLKDGPMRPLRRDIQMIFQDPYSSLNPRHPVGKIVGAPFRIQGVTPPGGVKKAVQDLLAAVGLNPEHYNRYPHEFSGGQRQRIGIARTLALRPRLIVADEPVSALDVSIQAQVLNLLEDLQVRPDVRDHCPRPVSGPLCLGSSGRDVSRQDRRAGRRGNAVRGPDAPVHGRVDVGRARARHPTTRGAGTDSVER
jgi:peptide/nickel transport system ATP-binding protein